LIGALAAALLLLCAMGSASGVQEAKRREGRAKPLSAV